MSPSGFNSRYLIAGLYTDHAFRPQGLVLGKQKSRGYCATGTRVGGNDCECERREDNRKKVESVCRKDLNRCYMGTNVGTSL